MLLKMWKEIVLGYLCLETITSQPLFKNNLRLTRQLDFGDCCPCTDFSKNQEDRKVSISTVGERDYNDDCPCRPIQDTEPASSIFRPALRTVEPFVRPIDTKGDPKPLLKPEVNLANSVLETLREATIQEYEEALERDAARNALLHMEDTEETSKNIVNIILKPKGPVDDVIPEASHVQETRCIHHPSRPLGSINQLSRVRPQSSRFGGYILTPKASNVDVTHKKYFDMANSASNVQEQVSQPLKSTLLEDLKLKSNLLKMKLFPNLKYGLKNIQPKDTVLYPKVAKIDCDDFNNNQDIDLKISNTSQNKEIDKNDDVILIDDPTQNVPSADTNIPMLENNLFSKDLTKNDCNDKIAVNLSTEPNPIEILDLLPNPSEIYEIKDIEEGIDDENNKKGSLNKENKMLTDDTSKQILPEDTPIRIILLDSTTNNNNKSSGIFSDNELNESDSSCPVTDSGSDIISNIFDTDREINDNIVKSDDPDIRGNESIIGEEILSRAVTESNLLPKNCVDDTTSATIQADVLQMQQKIKLANEDNQEKHRLNVQNSLQSGVLKSDLIPETEFITLGSSKDFVTEKTMNNNGDISMHDLEHMSNRILNLSELTELSKNANYEASNNDEVTVKNSILAKNITQFSKSPLQPSKASLITSEELGDINLTNNKNHNIENDMAVDSSIRINVCDNIASSNSDFTESNIKVLNDQNEMISEASNPYVNSIPQNSNGLMFEPSIIPNSNVKEFLENLRSSVSNILNSDNESTITKTFFGDNKNDNLRANSMQNQQFNLIEPSSRLSEPRFNDLNKSYYKTLGKETFNLRKSNDNLNSYKAKVASPDSLNMKSMPAVKNMKPVLSRRLTDDTFIRPTNNILNAPLPREKPSHLPLKALKNVDNSNSISSLKHSLISKEVLPATGSLKDFSDKLRTQTEEALKRIHDTFDTTFRKAPLKNDNNIFSETFTKPIIYETISKSNSDLSKKLQDFNKNLMDRLTLASSRVSERDSWKMKNKVNDLGDRLKSNLQTKSPGTLKNTLNLPTKTKITRPILNRREEISKPLLQQKSDPRLSSDLIKNPLKLGQGLKFKTANRSDIKRKLLKENKVTISPITTSVRPQIIKTSKKIANPSPALPPIKAPQILSSKSATQRKLELKSKLKPGEQHSLASEKYISQAVPDKYFNKSPRTYISEEEIGRASTVDFSEEADITKNANHLSAVKTGNKLGSLRLRDSLNGNNNINKNKFKAITDAASSASNNNVKATSMSSSLEKPLKENVSYRCKMVCFEDPLDSK